jgi:hypothetical protein
MPSVALRSIPMPPRQTGLRRMAAVLAPRAAPTAGPGLLHTARPGAGLRFLHNAPRSGPGIWVPGLSNRKSTRLSPAAHCSHPHIKPVQVRQGCLTHDRPGRLALNPSRAAGPCRAVVPLPLCQRQAFLPRATTTTRQTALERSDLNSFSINTLRVLRHVRLKFPS